MAKKQTSTGAYIGKLVIGLILMYGIYPLGLNAAGIQPAGFAALGIFVGVLFLILTGYGLILPAMLGLFAIIQTGVYTPATMISTTFGGSTIFQLIMVYAVCEGLTMTGAGEFLAKWMISRKSIQGKPYLFTFVYLLACVVMGAVVGMGGIVFMYTIQDYIKDELGYETESKWSKAMSIATFVAAQSGMALLPFKGMPFIIFAPMIAAMEKYGIELNYGVYMLIAAIVIIVLCLMMIGFMKLIWKTDMSKLVSLDITKREDMQNLKMTKHQLYCTLAFLLTILYSLALIVFKDVPSIYKPLNGITQGVWFMIVFIVMCMIRVDKKPIINPELALKNGTNWGVIITVCCFTLVGNMISSQDLGIRAWINTTVGPVFSAMAFPIFMLILIFLCSFITNFMSNTALGMIMGTLAAPFVAQYATDAGINATVVMTGITVACMYAFLTMSASGCSPLFLCRKEIESDGKFVWTKGLSVSIVGTAIMWILFTVFAYIF